MIGDANVISAFWSSTSSQTLVHEHGRDQTKTTKELLDIATPHTSGEAAVGVVYIQRGGMIVPSGKHGALPKAASKGAKRSTKGSKRGKTGTPNRSLSLPVINMVMTRQRMAPTRNTT
jgi:hypothetical protein